RPRLGLRQNYAACESLPLRSLLQCNTKHEATTACVAQTDTVIDLAGGGVQGPARGLVHEVVPISVEADDVAVIDADKKGFERLLGGRRKHS
ncbi:MAG: hypothetical protein ACLPH3_17995, partial [Terracidiphilus sp.]